MADREMIPDIVERDDHDTEVIDLDTSHTGVIDPRSEEKSTQDSRRDSQVGLLLKGLESMEYPPAVYEQQPASTFRLGILGGLTVAYSFSLWAVAPQIPTPAGLLLFVLWVAVLYVTVVNFLTLIRRSVLEIDEDGITIGPPRQQSTLHWSEISRVGMPVVMSNAGYVAKLVAWTLPGSTAVKERPFVKMVQPFSDAIVLCKLRQFQLSRSTLEPVLKRYAGGKYDGDA